MFCTALGQSQYASRRHIYRSLACHRFQLKRPAKMSFPCLVNQIIKVAGVIQYSAISRNAFGTLSPLTICISSSSGMSLLKLQSCLERGHSRPHFLNSVQDGWRVCWRPILCSPVAALGYRGGGAERRLHSKRSFAVCLLCQFTSVGSKASHPMPPRNSRGDRIPVDLFRMPWATGRSRSSRWFRHLPVEQKKTARLV